MKRLLQITLMTFVMTGLTTVALAQSGNADITASAEVISVVNVTPGNNLNFGTVTPGTPSSVAVTDGNAGTFDISGNGGNLQLEFTALPTDLTGPGGNLPISFADGDASWSDNGTPSNPFNPNDSPGTSLDISADSDGTITVFIGGTVSPPLGLQAGTYNETITLTATYN